MIDADDRDIMYGIEGAGTLLKDFIKKYPYNLISKNIKLCFLTRQDLDPFVTALNNNDIARAFYLSDELQIKLLTGLTGQDYRTLVTKYKSDNVPDDEDTNIDDPLCSKCYF